RNLASAKFRGPTPGGWAVIGIEMKVLDKLRFFGVAAVAFAGLVAASSALAESELQQQYNVFSLSSQVEVDVDNDLMVAILAVQDEDKDPAVLANKINSTATWASNVLRPFATISFKTRDYQTYPRYDTSQSRRLIGWRASQSIELETDDFEAAAKAIQQLQEKLQVQSIQLQVKSETRDKASDVLMTKALNSFKDRARLIQQNMNSSGFRIMDVNIETGHGRLHDYADERQITMMESQSVETEASIEAGTTRVSVTVYGRIQLQ
nr:SIMPL domain-containing protein [Granulosicoccus sp.]